MPSPGTRGTRHPGRRPPTSGPANADPHWLMFELGPHTVRPFAPALTRGSPRRDTAPGRPPPRRVPVLLAGGTASRSSPALIRSRALEQTKPTAVVGPVDGVQRPSWCRSPGVAGWCTGPGAMRDDWRPPGTTARIRWLSPRRPRLSTELSTGCASLAARPNAIATPMRDHPGRCPVRGLPTAGSRHANPGAPRRRRAPRNPGRVRQRSVPHPVTDPRGEFLHVVVGLPALGHLGADLLGGVHDGGVIAAAERLTDLGQGEVRQLAAEVHGDLPGGNDLFGLHRAAQLVQRHREVLGGDGHDGGRVDAATI